MSGTKILAGFTIGDWVYIKPEVEGKAFVGRYAGTLGCIIAIHDHEEYPFSIKLYDEEEKSFGVDEITLKVEPVETPEQEHLRKIQETVDLIIENMAVATGIPISFTEKVDIRIDQDAPLADWEKELLGNAEEGEGETQEANDEAEAVHHPSHYTSHPSGIECKDVAGHYPFFIGSAIKYLWRAGLKDQDKVIQDLQKAVQFIEFEIDRLEMESI